MDNKPEIAWLFCPLDPGSGNKPPHVLLSIEDYQLLTGQQRNIADALAMPDVEDIELDPPKATIDARPADLS